MAVHAILERLHAAVQRGGDYLVTAEHVPERDRAGAAEIAAVLRTSGAVAARDAVERLAAEGRIDPVTRLSALQVIAASPGVRDLAEAARLADQQEYVALQLGGPELPMRLASADRHRGVVAFLMGRPAVALEWFTRAFERQRTPDNLANLLAALVALGDTREARELLSTVRDRFPPAFAEAVERIVDADADLAALR